MHKMKFSIITFVAACTIFIACQNSKNNVAPQNSPENSTEMDEKRTAGRRDPNRLLPNKLRGIPFGILAAHSPNPCYATREGDKFAWKHNTTISVNEDMQLVEYGSFVFTDDGWYLRVTFTAKDFEEHYGCKNGFLKKGVVYTDPSSWRMQETMTSGDAMWYYLAKNKNGQIYKGIAPIETEGSLESEASENGVSTYFSIKNSTLTWTGFGEIGDYSLTGGLQISGANAVFEKDTIRSGEILVDMRSISHSEASLVEHLNGVDFFEIEKYPSASFKLTKSAVISGQNANLTGILTIKDISKEMTIPAQIFSEKKGRIVEGKISIDRTLFGIKFNSSNFFSNLGDNAIKNNFELSFRLVE
jgi:polyisoprenoid-binding protein YceI